MFDYQAGEKYKLTMIMVGMTGVIVGSALTLFLAAPGDAPKARRGHGSARPQNYEGRGGSLRASGGAGPPGAGAGMEVPQAPPSEQVDKGAAQALVQGFLPLTWDFNSTTANRSQEQAMNMMTADCAQNYKLNVWTPDIAQAVTGAGMTSSFQPSACEAITTDVDGSVVIKVEGEQILNLQGQPPKPKHVSMEYLVKKTPSGLRVSGISESGNFGS